MKNFEEYKPKAKGKSDFYSWNLYIWLRKQASGAKWMQKTRIYKSEDGTLFIGARYDGSHDGVTGTRLSQLCSGSGSGKFPLVGCWVGSGKWQDVTEQFYAEYERIGVCAIHGDWAHNFTIDGDTRACEYCGKVERKRVELVEKVTWEDVV